MKTDRARSDEDLIAEIVNKMREVNPILVDAATTKNIIAEVYRDLEQPDDIQRRVRQAFQTTWTRRV